MLQQWFDNTATALDLQAQWEMAKMARWMFWATMGSIAVGIFGFGALLVSLWQTRSSIKTNETTATDARELGEAHARAYLHVDNMRFSSDGKAAIISIRNTGSTPAPMLCAGCEVKKAPPGRVREAIVFGSYSYKGWHSLPAGTSRDFRIDFPGGFEIVQENRARLDGIGGLMPGVAEQSDRVVVVGRIVWNDVFGQYLETGFVFFTEDVGRGPVKVPAGILPAFRLIDVSEVPAGMPLFGDPLGI
jgi:hypothetical protein